MLGSCDMGGKLALRTMTISALCQTGLPYPSIDVPNLLRCLDSTSKCNTPQPRRVSAWESITVI